MDILEILKNSLDNILEDDLEFFETELATGEYEDSYIAACKEQLVIARNWFNKDYKNAKSQEKQTDLPEVKKKKQPSGEKKDPFMTIFDVTPQSSGSITGALTMKDVILLDIEQMREQSDYKSTFKKYVKNNKYIDSGFVDANYSFFLPWELDAIVSVKQMDEAFLEKYFGAINKDKISRYQCFSESFFMKHFVQLNVEIVLTKGKNEWRTKEKRSKQLDVFLRLKGVKL